MNEYIKANGTSPRGQKEDKMMGVIRANDPNGPHRKDLNLNPKKIYAVTIPTKFSDRYPFAGKKVPFRFIRNYKYFIEGIILPRGTSKTNATKPVYVTLDKFYINMGEISIKDDSQITRAYYDLVGDDEKSFFEIRYGTGLLF